MNEETIRAKIAEHEVRVRDIQASDLMRELNQRVGAVLALRELLPQEEPHVTPISPRKGAVAK